MKPKENILFSWTSPKELIPIASSLIKRSLKVSSIIFLAMICMLSVMYLQANSALPQDSEFNLEKGFLGAAAAMIIAVFVGFVIMPISNRSKHISKYRIDDNGIHHDSQFIAWKKIAGFYHKPHSEHPDITVISVFVKFLFGKGNFINIFLGEESPADNIIETLNQRLPLLEDPDIALKETRLSKSQHAVMWYIVVLYSTVIISSPFLFKDFINSDNVIWFVFVCMLFTFFVGPGKLCQPLFFRKDKLTTPTHKFYVRRYASLYNGAALAPFYIFSVTLSFYF